MAITLSQISSSSPYKKRFLSKNMMLLWSNFAKNGSPGKSSNGLEWLPYNQSANSKNFLVLDNRRNMKLADSYITYKKLVELLNNDTRVNKLEKCGCKIINLDVKKIKNLINIFNYVKKDK